MLHNVEILDPGLLTTCDVGRIYENNILFKFYQEQTVVIYQILPRNAFTNFFPNRI